MGPIVGVEVRITVCDNILSANGRVKQGVRRGTDMLLLLN